METMNINDIFENIDVLIADLPILRSVCDIMKTSGSSSHEKYLIYRGYLSDSTLFLFHFD